MTDKFWWFVREREEIRFRKEIGDAPPFTDDPRLCDYWFPNIRRMDDPTTVWLHAALLGPLERPQDLVLATVAYRLFGSRETGQALLDMFLGHGYDEAMFLEAVGPLERPFNGRLFRHLRAASLAAAAATCGEIKASDGLSYLLRGASLREAHRAFCGVRGIGPELAYEIVLDLRHTAVLQDAQDDRYWAFPGRSAVEAAGTLLKKDLRSSRRADCDEALKLMQRLLETSQSEFADWGMSEVQRALTLFHFWSREALPTRRYRW